MPGLVGIFLFWCLPVVQKGGKRVIQTACAASLYWPYNDPKFTSA